MKKVTTHNVKSEDGSAQVIQFPNAPQQQKIIYITDKKYRIRIALAAFVIGFYVYHMFQSLSSLL